MKASARYLKFLLRISKELTVIVIWMVCFFGSLETLPAQELEGGSKEELERSLQASLARAEEPLIVFKLSYLESLKKAEQEAQAKGALEELLAVQGERKTYQDPGKRNYSNFPSLQRLRSIYESREPELKLEANSARAQVYQEALPLFEKEIRRLTQEGNLEDALALSKSKEVIEEEYTAVLASVRVAESSNAGIEEVLWEFDKSTSVERIRNGKVTESLEGFRIEKTDHEIPWVEAKKTISPPFRIRSKLKTENGNLRYYYRGKTLLIFNWEVKPTELRFHDPGTGRKFALPGKGSLTNNVFHDLVIDVLKEKLSVKLNGKLLAEFEGKYDHLNGRVGVGPAFGSIITVKEMKLVSLD